LLTVLNPSVTEGMDTLRLMLSNDDITNRRTRKQIEHSIRIRAFGLLIATALWPFIPLHTAIERRSGRNVERLVQNDSLLGYGELCDGEGEARSRSLEEICLRGVILTGLAITSRILAFDETAACGSPVEDLGGSREG
jgi:hypothetical protein